MQLVLRCMRHFISVLTQGIRSGFEEDGKSVSLIYQIIDPSIVQRRQDTEFSISITLNLLREVTQCPGLRPIRVELEHPAPLGVSCHREVFDCPIHFDRPDNRVCFSRDLLEIAVRTADTRLYEALEPFLEQPRKSRAAATDLLSQLGLHIASSLGGGSVSLEQVASSIGMSVRTLQRGLTKHGLDFNHLVEGIRRSLAVDYVARSGFSLTEIALLLGYAEASSFSRAFRRWTHSTPQQYRQGTRT